LVLFLPSGPMVYDDWAMRSTLAAVMAILVLAAHAPGLFTGPAVRTAGPEKSVRAGTASCCGTAACRMHAGGCQAHEGCSAAGVGANQTPEPSGKTVPRLCAAACGAERVAATQGATDPGTLEASDGPAANLDTVGSITLSLAASPSRASEPTDPPPRA
jgi:hypothetical protein